MWKNFIRRLPLWCLWGAIGGPGLAIAQPPTYDQCQSAGMSDRVCHERIIASGGAAHKADNLVRTFTPVNFQGQDKYDAWYARYRNWARDYGSRIMSKAQALRYYPNYPPPITPIR